MPPSSRLKEKVNNAATLAGYCNLTLQKLYGPDDNDDNNDRPSKIVKPALAEFSARRLKMSPMTLYLQTSGRDHPK